MNALNGSYRFSGRFENKKKSVYSLSLSLSMLTKIRLSRSLFDDVKNRRVKKKHTILPLTYRYRVEVIFKICTRTTRSRGRRSRGFLYLDKFSGVQFVLGLLHSV